MACGVGAVGVVAQPITNVDTSTPSEVAPNPRYDGVVRVPRVDLGVTGEMVLDRHGPLTVWITSGAKAWSGTLSVSFTGTSSESVVNHVAAATTPGRVTPVEIIARLPTGVTNVEVSANGRTVANLTQIPMGSELPLATVGSGTGMICTLGDVSLIRQTRDRLGLGLGGDITDAQDPMQATWLNVKVDAIRRVPQAWIAYEQCDMVVAASTALEALGERGRAPLMDWVRSGGHLVVVSDSASREWALAGCGDAIEMDDSATMDAPEALRDAFTTLRRGKPAAAYQVRTRTLRVRDTSWHAIWPLADEPDRSLGAQGPVGMGLVTVFGGDPGRWTPVASNDSGIMVWREIINPAIEGVVDTSQNAWTAGVRARATAASRRWLLSRTFDTSLPNPRQMSLLVMLLVIGLAVVLGPVDLLVLRKLKLRHRSHRSALAWLAATSLIAYVAPLAIRSSHDALARGRATDIVLFPDGGATEAATGVTLVYAGTGTTARLEGMGEGTWCTQGAIDSGYFYGGPRAASQALDVVQGAGASGIRQAMASEMDVGQWTFRIVEDIQPARETATPRIHARVERVGEEWRVTVDGLGDQARAIESCTLEVLGRIMGATLEREGTARWSGYANSAFQPFGPVPNEYGEYVGEAPSARLYRVQLPMTARRSRAFDAYASSEGWSLVTLLVHQEGSDVGVVGRAFAAKSIDVFRIAVPTPDARRDEAPHDAAEPAAPTTDPKPSEDGE